jgi:hypothetical protein
MIDFPFIGGTYPNGALPFTNQRTVNLYPERDDNYRNKIVLIGFPGHQKWTQCGNGPIRGAKEFDGNLYVVSGSAVYKVNPGGYAQTIGTIGTSTGHVSMDENAVQLMIVDGQDGWIYDGGTFQKILDATFTATKAGSVRHFDSFFVVNKPGTGQIWASDAFDGLSWTATKTATAEFKSDPLIGVFVDKELFLAGSKTIQQYYNSGASPMPLEAVRSSRITYGLAAKESWVEIGNTSYFLGQGPQGGVFCARLTGPSIERVSTRAWELEWSGYDYQDAYAMAVHFKGQEWYLLTFPKADTGRGRTFGFSISTGLWFEVGEFVPSINDFGKYSGVVHVSFSKRNLIGTEDGWLHEMRDDKYTFDGTTMISLRRCPVVHDKEEPVFLSNFTVGVEKGVENADSRDPQLHMKHSKDGGYTFKNTRYKPLSGTHTNMRNTEMDFRSLGSAKNWVFEVSISDPVRRRFYSGSVA